MDKNNSGGIQTMLNTNLHEVSASNFGNYLVKSDFRK